MRTTLSTTTALTLAAGLLALAPPAAATDPGPGVDPQKTAATIRQDADRIMNLTYRGFARTPHLSPFDWTTDGCSVPTDYAPYRKVFRPACVQHDFGYRNYGSRHTLRLSPVRATKNWIDDRFRTELDRLCKDTYTTPLRLRACRTAKDAYYYAVHLGGDVSFF